MIIPFVNRLLHWMVTGIMTRVMSLMILSKGLTIESLGFISAATSLIVVILEFPSGILSLGSSALILLLAAQRSILPSFGFFAGRPAWRSGRFPPLSQGRVGRQAAFAPF